MRIRLTNASANGYFDKRKFRDLHDYLHANNMIQHEEENGEYQKLFIEIKNLNVLFMIRKLCKCELVLSENQNELIINDIEEEE